MKLGSWAQLFQSGASVLRNATTRPSPKRFSTTSGCRFRSLAITCPVDIAQVNRPVAGEVRGRGVAQERGRLELWQNARARTLARRKRRFQKVRVTLLGVAVDHEHWLALGRVDHAPAAVIGRKGIVG